MPFRMESPRFFSLSLYQRERVGESDFQTRYLIRFLTQ